MNISKSARLKKTNLGMYQILFFSAFLILIGCASVQVYPVKNEHGSEGKQLSSTEAGIRFFRPAFYVWITKAPLSEKVNTITIVEKQKNKTQTIVKSLPQVVYQANVVVLPDYTQEYIVQWHPGLGSIHPKFTLEGGWNLTGFDSTIDSKTAELVTAVSGAVKNVAAAAAGALIADENFKGPGLYKLEISPDGRLSLGKQVLGLE